MPMPPPKASTEGKRDRQVFHEMGQIVRALEVERSRNHRTGSPSWSGRRTGSATGSSAPWPSSSRTGSPTARRTGCWRLPERSVDRSAQSAERRAVRARSDTQGAVEVAAQSCRRAHAAADGDLLDGGVGAFEELLRAGDALLVQPVERTDPQLGVHPAGELPGAEAGLPGEVAHRQGLIEAGLRPAQRRREPVGAARLGGRDDELRLAAAAVGGHDQLPRDPVGGGCAEVATHDVDAQVERRRLARRGEHVALVDVEHVGPHVDPRVAARQGVGVHPVRRRDPAVEQPGRREQEGTGAQRRDPRAALVRHAQRLEERRVRVCVEVVGGRNDDDVGVGHLGVRRGGQVRQPRVWSSVDGADHEVVPLAAGGEIRPVDAEDLRGDRGLVEHRGAMHDEGYPGHVRNCTHRVVSDTGQRSTRRRRWFCEVIRTSPRLRRQRSHRALRRGRADATRTHASTGRT